MSDDHCPHDDEERCLCGRLADRVCYHVCYRCDGATCERCVKNDGLCTPCRGEFADDDYDDERADVRFEDARAEEMGR